VADGVAVAAAVDGVWFGCKGAVGVKTTSTQ
jgi:hypothetical protein